jgi:hypothetical protein
MEMIQRLIPLFALVMVVAVRHTMQPEMEQVEMVAQVQEIQLIPGVSEEQEVMQQLLEVEEAVVPVQVPMEPMEEHLLVEVVEPETLTEQEELVV